MLVAAQPLVSIVVPLTSDSHESEARLSSAYAQTWPNVEVISLECTAHDGLVHAINTGLSVCQGDFVSFLLPGAQYNPDKISMQVEFMTKFELLDSIVFCDYSIRRKYYSKSIPVQTPLMDPSEYFSQIYCGTYVDYNTLLISRGALAKVGFLDLHLGNVALFAFILALCQCSDFVGMRANLVTISGNHQRLLSSNKRHLRQLFADLLPIVLQSRLSSSNDDNLFKFLGAAAGSRLIQRLPVSCFDILFITIDHLKYSSNQYHSFNLFVKSFLRRLVSPLPLPIKRFMGDICFAQSCPNEPRLDFSEIYKTNGFAGTESLSGAGSTLFQTRIVRRILPELFSRFNIQSILDIPCGDFHWMRYVDLSSVSYIGADIVVELVNNNQAVYGSPSRLFESHNLITGPLPRVDLIFCRDCLVHLPFDDISAAIKAIRDSESKWLLTTTFTRDVPNIDLDSAGWRPLNLRLPPFCLPEPVLLISEKCTEGGGLSGDKSLGLWRISDLHPHEQSST